MLKILSVPDKKLRQVSQSVERIDHQLIQFIGQLSDTLIHSSDPPGVGLSAIQVGRPLRLFITYLPTDKSLPARRWRRDNLEITVYLNPRLVATSKKATLGGSPNRPTLEGCLSIPNIWGPVYRHEWVKLHYSTISLNSGEETNFRSLFRPGSSALQNSLASRLKSDNAQLKSSINEKISVSEHEEKLSGFAARVIQHEMDHLNGILFTDYTLSTSPSPHFQSLGQSPALYFNHHDDFKKIADPIPLLTW